MSWINYTMHCCEKRLVYIKKNSCLYLVQHSQKSLCPENISFISLIMIMISLNQYRIGSYLMQCCLNRPIYLKALSSELRILLMFLLLQQNFLLSASFLSSEAELNVFNQHWIINCPMQCWSNRLVCIKANSCFYLVANISICSSFWIRTIKF